MGQTYVAGAAVATTLTGPLNNLATTFAVVAATGWPGSVPFVLALDRGTASEEKVLVTARTGTTITTCTRGYDGTSAVAHSVGTNNVEHVISATQVQELIDHTNDAATGFEHTAAGIASDAITTVKILDANVTLAKLAANSVDSSKIVDGSIVLADLASALQAFLVPTGTLLDFAGAAAPAGFLLCDGTAVSRATYTSLFSVIGTTYGVGDGSTTFNLPDFRDRTTIGKSGTKALGTTGGSADSIVVSHSHSHDHGSHNHYTTHHRTNNEAVGYGLTISGGFADRVIVSASGNGDLTTLQAPTTDATSAGLSGTGSNLPPWVAVNKIVKT